MPKLWLATSSEMSLRAVLGLLDETPPRFRWLNETAAHEAGKRTAAEYRAHGMADVEPLAFRAMPEPVFEIADPDFAFDFFEFATITCVSRRLRSVLDLPADVVAYRDVDVSRSVTGVRAMDYAAMQPLAFADPFDHDRTPGQMRLTVAPDGTAAETWWRPAIPVPGEARPIAWRVDFVPPASLFRIPRMPWMLATEELAARVMAAGIGDLVFQEIEGDGAPGHARYRQR